MFYLLSIFGSKDFLTFSFKNSQRISEVIKWPFKMALLLGSWKEIRNRWVNFFPSNIYGLKVFCRASYVKQLCSMCKSLDLLSHINTHIYIQPQTYIHTCTKKHIHPCTYMHTCIQTYVHTHTACIYIYTHIHKHILTDKHKHTCTHPHS